MADIATRARSPTSIASQGSGALLQNFGYDFSNFAGKVRPISYQFKGMDY